MRDLALDLVTLLSFTRAHHLSLLRALWVASLPSSTSTAPRSLVLAAKDPQAALCPTVHATNKDVKQCPLRDCLTRQGTALLVTVLLLQIKQVTTTLGAQPSSQFLIHQAVHQSHPQLPKSETKMPCRTVSNALHKSMKGIKNSKLFPTTQTLAEVLLGSHVTYRLGEAQKKSSWQ